MQYERDQNRAVKRVLMFDVIEKRPAGLPELIASFRYANQAFAYALGEMTDFIYLRRASDRMVIGRLRERTPMEIAEWARSPQVAAE